MNTVNGKRILFISPEFFGIDRVIIEILKEKGATVVWVNERCVKSSIGRAINSINPAFFYFKSNAYYRKIISNEKKPFDIIFVIKGEMISKKTIDYFRRTSPEAQLILYLYDPLVYIKGLGSKYKLYDRVISFEPDDCRENGFEFRPLFCDFRLKKTDDSKPKTFKYKICFYGTMYGDRFQIVENIKRICSEQSITFFSFCYLRGKFMAVYYWFRSKSFRHMGSNIISFIPKTAEELSEIINSSEVVLDINDVLQKGLTLRTIESLVSGKKIITTNQDIVNYDFYNPDNILVIDRKKIIIPDSFLQEEYVAISPIILKKYSAEGWVNDVFLKG